MTGRLSGHVFTSELTKIRSLRSISSCLTVTFILTLSLSLVSGWSIRRAIDTHSLMLLPGFNPASAGFDNVSFAQLGLITFGVLLVTSEYVTGMIRLSLAAVPQRGLLYSAKMVAGGATAFLFALPLTILSYSGTQLGLGPHAAPFTTPGLPRALIGGALYLTMISLISAGIATMLRSQILSLALVLPMFSVGSQILSQIQSIRASAKYLPDLSGARAMAVTATPSGSLTPGVGLSVMLLWTLAALVGGYLVLRRRDA